MRYVLYIDGERVGHYGYRESAVEVAQTMLSEAIEEDARILNRKDKATIYGSDIEIKEEA